jgi:NhaP-type Na+/H+ or K+/H+ antiporter
MDPYIAVLIGFGVVVLLTAWLPMVLKELPLSLPIACLAIGAAVFALPGLPGVPDTPPRPAEHLEFIERLTEMVVIVALMGAGLKLDRPLSWKSAALTWRLLALAMPLTILALALMAQALLGVGLAAAMLLASALAPTDPVLASDIQVGPPHEGEEDEVRYALTSEAGLNDGLAFPFVNLALALAIAADTGEPWLADWLLIDVAWKLTAGLVLGVLIGRGLGWLAFRLPNRARLSSTKDGFVALGITAVAYGLTEAVHGYGFIAVFVAAVAFRAVERRHRYHATLHAFAEQLERLLMMALLVLLGGAVSAGGLLAALDGRVWLFALAAIFVVRPAIAWISLLGRPEPVRERAVVSFFGVRGLGSVYYLAYGLGHAGFAVEAPALWSAAALVIVLSIVIHGVTVTPVMRMLYRRGRASTRPLAGPAQHEGN